MTALAGYELGEPLPSGHGMVFRGRRLIDGRRVILKLTSPSDPTGKRRDDLAHEYELLRALDIRGVPRALELATYQGRPVLVIEDTCTPTLRETCRNGAMALAPFLDLAIQLVEILAQIHEAGIIHKDINPSNVMLDPDTGRVDLIDFGISSRLPRETASYHTPNLLEGTLPYLSPEQTGRMNRAVDYRSDFYALGMTFYELVTGQVAFQSADPLELCHCHIAKIPAAPSVVNPAVPEPLSQIVMKLIAKMAEQRYQSAYGLLVDLRACQQQLASGAGLDGFVAGARDVSRALSIPQKLYGREAEVGELLGSFDRVCAGGVELVTVSGYSGIGKSSLIHEVHRPIVKSGGYFISGKFDQYRRDVPYEAFVQAIRQLCRELLLEGEQQFPAWQRRFEDQLGGNAAVLAELIPDIELFTGVLPPPHEVGAADAQRRLITAFQQLLGMFVTLGRPLVVFLDDLQWADPASLTLLQALATTNGSRHLMLIGAYRDNEVDASHPLQLTWNAIDAARIVTRRQLNVRPLGLAHIEELIGDAFGASRSSAQRLASLLAAKTSGNPFFLGQMLVSLHRQSLIEFDPRTGEWRWDTERIASAAITDNVVDLMLGELRRVPPDTQRLLQRAACIGNRFALDVLATVDGQSVEATAQTLWQALVAGFILPEDDTYRQSAATADGKTAFRFSHDRVRQAAYAMTPEHERAEIHLQIGRMMLAAHGNAARTDGLPGSEVFEVFSHFSAAIGLLESRAERTAVARIALTAGTRARVSHAYDTAAHVLEIGYGLLADDAWNADYDLALALAMELAHAEYQSGRFERAERRFREIIEHARALHERADAYRTLLTLHETAARYGEALGAGFECMKLFGIDVSLEITAEDAIAMMHQVLAALGERTVADLIDSPPLTDRAQLALSRVLLRLSSIAYFVGQAFYTAISSQAALVYVKYGITESSPAMFAYFASTLCSWDEYDAGFAFADLSLAMHDRLPDDHPGHVTYLHGGWMVSLREHLRVTLEWLGRAYQECVAAGDLNTATYALLMAVGDSFVRGTNLAELHQEAVRTTAFCSKVQAGVVHGVTAVDRAVLCLLGATHDPTTYNDVDGFDEVACEAEITARSPHNVLLWWHAHRAFVHYVFGDFAAAHARTQSYLPLEWAIHSQIRVPEFRFHRALIGLARWPQLSADEQRDVLDHAERTHIELDRRVAMTPTTFGPRVLLLAAEIARVRNSNDAGDLYDAAIASAIEHDHIQIAAISCECALRFALARNRVSRARGYLVDAIQHYSTWGAARKVVQLTERHRMLLPSSSTQTIAVTRTVHGRKGALAVQGTRSASGFGAGLDLHTATKASQAISSEIQLDRLLEKLTKILIESAGAERGFIVLKTDDRLLVEAAFTAAGEVRVLEAAELVSYPGLPAGIVTYVARSGGQIVLENATRSSFASDPHIIANGVKSVLCLPITNQNRLVGVVYLENNLVEGCFTVDRIEVLRILMTQIAISIDNARLYAGMEAKVRERTAALAAREHSLRLILDSTGDGLLSVDLHGHVRGEISAATAAWFPEIAEGAAVWDALAPDDPAFRWTLEFGIAQLRDDVLPFEVGVGQLPRRLARAGKTFALDYKQVFEAEAFARLLVVVRDVTAEIAAERAGREARQRQDILAWLLKDREGLRAFVSDAEQILGQLRSAEPVIAKRLLHTLKGNAALYSFQSVAEHCHTLESQLDDLGDAAPTDEQVDALAAVFSASLRGLDELLQLQRTAIEIADGEYTELIGALESRWGYSELLELVQGWRWPRAADQLARLGGQIGQLARKLDKAVRITITDHELRLAPHRLDGFLANLVHVARNAVDHGIESPDERVRLGKSAEGEITLALRLERDELVVEISDDGRGVDTGALAGIAARRGLPLRDQRDVVDLLFTDGVSTRGQVTDTSGRGVGLAAVRAACEELGGRVDVSWIDGHGTTFRFAFPAALARTPHTGADRARRSLSSVAAPGPVAVADRY